MDFKVEKQDTYAIIYLEGNLVSTTAGITLSDELYRLMEEDVKLFIIDLNEIEHINSVGLGTLITLLTKARRIGGDVYLSRPSAFVENLLVMTKLNMIFKIFSDLELAKNAVQES